MPRTYGGPGEPDSAVRPVSWRVTGGTVRHFYGGDPIRLIILHPDGTSEDVWLGTDIDAGQRVQFVIRAGT